MVRVIVETAFAKTAIFPSAYSVDVVNTPHDDMLVVAYSDNGADKVATYPMKHVYRYTVCPPQQPDEEETTEDTES